MCPDMDTYCVQAVRTSNVNGIGHHSKLLLVIGLRMVHSFILNDSLSHDGFALLLHLHGSTATDFLHKSSCSLRLLEIAGLSIRQLRTHALSSC